MTAMCGVANGEFLLMLSLIDIGGEKRSGIIWKRSLGK